MRPFVLMVMCLLWLLVTACGASPATTEPDGGNTTNSPATEIPADIEEPPAEGDIGDNRLLDSAVPVVDTTGATVGEVLVTLTNQEEVTIVEATSVQNRILGGWQVTFMGQAAPATALIVLPKNLGTGTYQVSSTVEAVGGDGLLGVGMDMAYGVGSDVIQMDITQGQIRVQSVNPLTAEITFIAPNTEGVPTTVKIVMNQLEVPAS